MSVKKYGGVIQRWQLSPFMEQYEMFEGVKTLGFVVYGYLDNDPTGRFGRGPIRTSLVVKFSDEQIETLNTIYDLGGPLARST